MIVQVSKTSAAKGDIVDMLRANDGWVLSVGGAEYSVADDSGLSVLGRDSYKVVMQSETEGKVVRFADLHGHTDNSLLDGMVKVRDKIAATEYCAAITDHGVMYGFVEFFKGMKKAGKKPIVGFEAYCENLDGELNKNHLILLAKNLAGYKNLLKLCSEASNHFHGKPHVTWEMLERYHEGVICASACLAGIIPQYLLAGQEDKAQEAFRRYRGIFGEDFYIEIQRHQIPDEDAVRPLLVKMAKENGVKYIATTDSHYLRKEDAAAHEVLLCLQTKKLMSEPHMKFDGTGYHIHSSEEMEQLFADYPEALDATLDLADSVSLEVPLGDVDTPRYDVPGEFSNEEEYFEFLCEKGFKDRFTGTPKLKNKEYRSRLAYEIGVIKQMGFPGYFLIVWDFINWARQHNIYVGPGRGSAAGSLVAYCLGITDLDPIQYNLLFERFLNPERISMPDIDVDFEHVRRQEVFNYVAEKYGAESVCHIITFGTMAARMAVKDVARVLGYTPGFGAQVSKMIPAEVNMTIDRAMLENPDFKAMYDTNPDAKRIVDIAKSLEGSKRHSSVHACGVLVSSHLISESIPTAMVMDDETGEKVFTSQVVGPECEELSVLKFDFLGLKNMSVIHEVHDGVIRDFGLANVLKGIGVKQKEFRYQDIPMTDRETYKMLAEGKTAGVFQLESPGMTRVITEMYSDIDTLPDEELGQCFERLIASVALYRPGPMDYIPDYQSGMRDASAITYDTPEEEGILAPTYGVLVYQEQLMQIAQKLAGYNLGEADVIRKGCAKKKQDILNAEHKRFVFGNKEEYDAGKAKHFVPGCVGNGISEQIAEDIWYKITKFGSYAFNRSHAACYAFIAYLTAYMSCHWPVHFYCAMLNAFVENSDKMKAYLAQAARRGIKLLPPDVNKSQELFSVDLAENGIRFGLRGIASMNKIVDAVVSERNEHGLYRDIEDLYLRVSDSGKRLSKAQMEKLIFSGALDSFGYNRREQQALISLIITDAEKNKQSRTMGQFSLFAAPEWALVPPTLNEYAKKELLEKEYEALGIYLSGHPVTEAFEAAKKSLWPKPMAIIDLLDNNCDGQRVTCIGQVRNLVKRFTKTGDPMYGFDLCDQFQSVKCVVFNRNLNAVEPHLGEGKIVGITGRFQKNDNFGDQLVSESAFSEEAIVLMKTPKLVITVTDLESQQELLKVISSARTGSTAVSLITPGSSKEFPIKQHIYLSADLCDRLMQGWQVKAV